MSPSNKPPSSNEDPEPKTSVKLSPELRLHITRNPDVHTFMHDDKLPNLPLPALEVTMTKYVESCRPLLSNEEMDIVQGLVKDFLEGQGPVLHKKLQERAETHRNWLDTWWLNHAYLQYRLPLIPNMNTGGPQTLNMSSLPPSKENALWYAAVFTHTVLRFFQELRHERVRPTTSMRGQPFSMDQFRRLFNTCRIPGRGCDSLSTYWKTASEGSCPHHIVVLCRGHIWQLNPFYTEGELLTMAELEQQFSYIRTKSDEMGVGPCLSALTTLPRDDWHKYRTYLLAASPKNAPLFTLVESAIMVVVLEEYEPKNMAQASWMSVCGDSINRWADKSLTGIISKNGYVASNCDHTPFDAMVLVVLLHFQQTLLKEMDLETERLEAVREDLAMPTQLIFEINALVRRAVLQALDSTRLLTSQVVVSFDTYRGFGKNWMKANGVHPDALVQMALQLAYYRTHNKMAPTYETATTRQFYKGRTETVRSCTSEAKLFVEAMQEQNRSVARVSALLRAACARHDREMRECQRGGGLDRHMFGLMIAALESGHAVPAIFSHPTFTKTGGNGNFVLSTSTIGYNDSTGGVAPMVANGYGCFYSMLPTSIYLFITAFTFGGTLHAASFSRVIKECLDDMKKVLDATATPSSSTTTAKL